MRALISSSGHLCCLKYEDITRLRPKAWNYHFNIFFSLLLCSLYESGLCPLKSCCQSISLNAFLAVYIYFTCFNHTADKAEHQKAYYLFKMFFRVRHFLWKKLYQKHCGALFAFFPLKDKYAAEEYSINPNSCHIKE